MTATDLDLDLATDLAISSARTIQGPEFPIHYHDVGEGPPLVMIQAYGALPGSSAWMTYHAVVEDLATSNRCLLIDMPNYGLTGPVEYHEPVHDVYARTVIAVMDAEGIPDATVIGLSIGGTTGIVLALSYPERVQRLVIGSCHASTGGDPYVLAPFPSEVGRLTREALSSPLDPEKIRRQLVALWYDADLVTDELVQHMVDARIAAPEHLAAALASTTTPKSHIVELSQIAMPVLVIHGRFDRMVPLEQALMLTSYIPQADLAVINRCGHWPPFERPAEYLRHVRAFLTA